MEQAWQVGKSYHIGNCKWKIQIVLLLVKLTLEPGKTNGVYADWQNHVLQLIRKYSKMAP
jgi:hypothetical protein